MDKHKIRISWSEYFTYEKETGRLHWKIKPCMRVSIGDIAGCINHGYRKVRLKGKLYLNHRVIWEMIFGNIPYGIQVDHIDHDRDNNRLDNLRLVTRQANQHNRARRADNISGANGVCWDKRNNKWSAKIKYNGKNKHLGHFTDINDAISARKLAEKSLGFHPNHGN
ncbi:HNH endonuclease signature motif containing protein [Yersinia alsatica]|uniref:HNH endonuclease signature motif containing protein n=1 Tax=Yersinia alsatica TaxID=2890317 RepID=UPI0011A94B4A|nr:HNH endonuclease signature motif containing protein [Yersinia alsatica]